MSHSNGRFTKGTSIPLSIEGTFLSGSDLRGVIRAARLASLHAARVERGQRKNHTHHAQNAQNAQQGVPKASLEAYFQHAQNAEHVAIAHARTVGGPRPHSFGIQPTRLSPRVRTGPIGGMEEAWRP